MDEKVIDATNSKESIESCTAFAQVVMNFRKALKSEIREEVLTELRQETEGELEAQMGTVSDTILEAVSVGHEEKVKLLVAKHVSGLSPEQTKQVENLISIALTNYVPKFAPSTSAITAAATKIVKNKKRKVKYEGITPEAIFIEFRAKLGDRLPDAIEAYKIMPVINWVRINKDPDYRFWSSWSEFRTMYSAWSKKHPYIPAHIIGGK